jgi:hypothetical protein
MDRLDFASPSLCLLQLIWYTEGGEPKPWVDICRATNFSAFLSCFVMSSWLQRKKPDADKSENNIYPQT